MMAGIARGTSADVNVIALVGERGREVKEFIVDALGREGLERSVVVVATGRRCLQRRARLEVPVRLVRLLRRSLH